MGIIITHTCRQPVEIVMHEEITHYINAGKCLGCSESAILIEENGQHMGTINPRGDRHVVYVDVENH